MFYLVKTPWWLKRLYPDCTWHLPGDHHVIYLTFDDGPHPEITSFVLEQLAIYEAKATFFCIGKNVAAYPQVYRNILDAGHAVGNHTQHHLNGFKVKDADYIHDIEQATAYIDSKLFRPPYGRASRFQQKIIREKLHLQPIMWSVLSGDFDSGISKERCLENVLLHTKPGDIVVMHDSEKANEKLRWILPRILAHFHQKGLQFKPIILPAQLPAEEELV